jgi:hypothetical protein
VNSAAYSDSHTVILSMGKVCRASVATNRQSMRGRRIGSALVFQRAARHRAGEIRMLFTLAVILLIAWLLGVVGAYTIGAFVHVLLLVAVVLVVVGLVSGRRTLA